MKPIYEVKRNSRVVAIFNEEAAERLINILYDWLSDGCLLLHCELMCENSLRELLPEVDVPTSPDGEMRMYTWLEFERTN